MKVISCIESSRCQGIYKYEDYLKILKPIHWVVVDCPDKHEWDVGNKSFAELILRVIDFKTFKQYRLRPGSFFEKMKVID